MFEKEKFSKVLENIISKYESLRKFSDVSKFNRTSVSKYVRNELPNPPSPAKLKDIANNSKGVTTYEELMKICGYISYSNNNQEVQELINMLKNLDLTEKEFNGLINYINKKNTIQINITKENYDNSADYLEDYINLKDDLKYELKNSLSKKQLDAYFIILELQTYNFAINELYMSIFNKSNKIPVLGSIPAGIPIELIEDIIDFEEISYEMLKGGKQYFALKVKGTSMWPKYLDGDTIIVLKQDDCESGQDAIVMVNGNDGTFKRVIKKDTGITLEPINQQEYNSVSYSNEDIEKLPVRILGVVKEIRRSV